MPTLKHMKTPKGGEFIFVFEGKKKHRFSKRKHGIDYELKAKAFLNKLNSKPETEKQEPEQEPVAPIENPEVVSNENDLIVDNQGTTEGVSIETNYPKMEYDHLFKNKDESYTCCIIGNSKSGKTTFLSELYKKIRPMYDIIFFISNSIHKPIYNFIPEKDKKFTMENYNPDLIKFLFKLQKSTNNHLRLCVILDDEISSPQDYQLKKLYAMGRNFNISTIKSIQDFSFISRSARENTNYL